MMLSEKENFTAMIDCMNSFVKLGPGKTFFILLQGTQFEHLFKDSLNYYMAPSSNIY